MSKGITKILPSGNRITYVPKYSIVKVHGKLSAVHSKKVKEAGVLIQYKCNGRKVFRPNSYYEHITPLKYSK